VILTSQKNEVGVEWLHIWWREEVYTGFWWGNRRERDYLENPGIDGRIILRWTFRKLDVREWTGSTGSGSGQVVGTCECGNVPSGSIKC
jgi:hypothetical protein